jgi:hypothetical protein
MKKALSLSFNLLIAMLIGTLIGAPLLGAGAGLLSSAFHKNSSGTLNMALQVEVWQRDIVDTLFADNSFLSKAFNADSYVLQGKVVHVPQSGGPSSVSKNRDVLPGVVLKRTDTDRTYSLDEYTTDPRLIQETEKVEASYDKRNSVIAEDKANLVESVSNEFVYKWSPAGAASILRTTGAEILSHMPSATGNRLAVTVKDVAAAKIAMNKQNVPKTDRYCLIDSDMYAQLLDSMTEAAQIAFHSAANAAEGTIGKLHGFSFYERSSAGRYSNAATPVAKAPEAAAAVTDNAAAIFWQVNSVERALGEVKAFDNPGDATYYGDIVSFLIRAGGHIRRTDNKGVIALVQAVPAG